jgi:hypothetical protein
MDNFDEKIQNEPHIELYEHLIPGFFEAMNDIGVYGAEKYGVESFHQLALNNDRTRTTRTQTSIIATHAKTHFSDYIYDFKHDHFHTLKHQLAAVAFNAMMEYYFANLDEEK